MDLAVAGGLFMIPNSIRTRAKGIFEATAIPSSCHSEIGAF